MIPRAKFFKLSSDSESLDLMSNSILNESIDISALEKQGVVFPTYTVTNLDLGRPDKISFNIYKDTSYWSILMRINNIVDPVNDIYEGMTLKILPLAVLNSHLNSAISTSLNPTS